MALKSRNLAWSAMQKWLEVVEKYNFFLRLKWENRFLLMTEHRRDRMGISSLHHLNPVANSGLLVQIFAMRELRDWQKGSFKVFLTGGVHWCFCHYELISLSLLMPWRFLRINSYTDLRREENPAVLHLPSVNCRGQLLAPWENIIVREWLQEYNVGCCTRESWGIYMTSLPHTYHRITEC